MFRKRLTLLLALAAASCARPPAADRAIVPDSTSSPAAAEAEPAAPAPAPEPAPSAGAAAVALPAVRPAGADEILALVRDSKSPAVLINVWATWCAPCRHEFPDLMRLERAYRDRGLQVILVSADFDDQMPDVRRFLTSQRVDFPTYIKNEDDMKFINALNPRWSGALPATFIYDADKKLRAFHEGQATFDYFEQQVLDIVNPKTPTSPKEEHS